MKTVYLILLALAFSPAAHALPEVICLAENGSELRATAYCLEQFNCDLEEVHMRVGRGDHFRLYPKATGKAEGSLRGRSLDRVTVTDPKGAFVKFEAGANQAGVPSWESLGTYTDASGTHAARCGIY
jgi:hypothetical protein